MLLVLFATIIAHFQQVYGIVGGEVGVLPPIDDPAVYVRFAGRGARVEGAKEYGFYLFKGLRYGYPPLGKNRFLRPREYFLNGVINATAYPPPCPQPVPNEDRIIGDEDCLFLNVFTPELPTGMEGLPVMIWIHGGGFRYGSGSQYGVKYLVGKRLVVVTIQYRLGSLGFLSTGDKQLPGNAALWDMILAVQWTRNYIGFFGGNPHRIVVMGHGTGANSAILMALSEVAKGRQTGVIAMSGTPVTRFATNDAPRDIATTLADYNGCPTTTSLTMVRCLQNVPAAELIKADAQVDYQKMQQYSLVNGLTGRSANAPVNEGPDDGRSLPGFIQASASDMLQDQKQPGIPLLTGVVRDETRRACDGPYKEDLHTRLKTIPNYLNDVLVRNLQHTLGIGDSRHHQNGTAAFVGAWTKIDPIQFTNYIKVKKNDLNEGLVKISEMATDALFNVPAYMTVDQWSKKKESPAFLYSFDYSGSREKGYSFLNGIPLVGNSSNVEDNIVGHGDELSYLFEPQDVFGVPMNRADSSAQDNKVAETFLQLVADFVRYGQIKNNGDDSVQSFSSSENNFYQISDHPKVMKNFKFCQIALWVGLLQRLQSGTCSLFKVLDSQLKTVQNLFDVTSFGNVTTSNTTLYFTNTQDDLKKKVKQSLGILGIKNL